MLDRETRRRVLEAAGPIFAAKGFEATTVREICARAGANVSAVNYHFRSKEQLYVEAVRHAYESIAARAPLPTFPPEMPPRERLRLFIRGVLARFEKAQAAWHCDLIMREVSQPTAGACADIVEGFIRPTFRLLMAALDGLLPPDLPADKRGQLAGSIIGQCLHFHHARHVTPLLMGPDQAAGFTAERWADHVTAFSLAALDRLYPRDRGARP
jgi:AcrR family transcriptional regulator